MSAPRTAEPHGAEVVLLPLALLGAVASSAEVSALPLRAAHALKRLGLPRSSRVKLTPWKMVL